MSTYKLYVSGYIEETQQLLISFSSDRTLREAEDYPALAFNVVPYGDATPEEIMEMIAKTAPTTTGDIVTQETYTDSSEKAQGLKSLVGQSFSFSENELFPVATRQGGRDNTLTDWNFSGNQEIDNDNANISFIYPSENISGGFMEQTSADGLPRNASGDKIPHDTIGNVYVGFDNYVLSSGRVTYSAEWVDGDITEAQMDDYVAWLQGANFGNDIENLTRTDTSLSWDFVPKDETGGDYSLLRYQPNSQFKVTIADDDTRMCCFLRSVNEGHLWNTGSYSIRGGESLVINKSGATCYLSFVGDTFEINDVAVADMSVKNLTSNSVTVVNTGAKARKIGVIWKD